ncbi:MAG: hypothetical protein QMC80_01860 [Thermoplasmatales archaeon]|nr:hypothetical protein [Thermoplasmatales archaeon]
MSGEKEKREGFAKAIPQKKEVWILSEPLKLENIKYSQIYLGMPKKVR